MAYWGTSFSSSTLSDIQLCLFRCNHKLTVDTHLYDNSAKAFCENLSVKINVEEFATDLGRCLASIVIVLQTWGPEFKNPASTEQTSMVTFTFGPSTGVSVCLSLSQAHRKSLLSWIIHTELSLFTYLMKFTYVSIIYDKCLHRPCAVSLQISGCGHSTSYQRVRGFVWSMLGAERYHIWTDLMEAGCSCLLLWENMVSPVILSFFLHGL